MSINLNSSCSTGATENPSVPSPAEAGGDFPADPQSLDWHAVPYEQRTEQELYERARKLRIPGRSKMNKQQLIEALRKPQWS